MRDTLEQVERTSLLAIQTPLQKEISYIPDSIPGTDGIPEVVITGDVRLRVTESFAALGSVNGRYRIETDGIQEPFHVIWIIEGQVLNHTIHSIEVAFDLRGMSAGETLTRLLTAQVTERNGQERIIHSSIFIQISVVK
ncbi:MAG TPA: hypothetical protein VKU38_06615 [Ktedonobacteraceae bacterium]|nr:hypothetical protein [Ktedonobacteraceae bacterium]